MDIKDYERMVPHATVDGIGFLTPNSQCVWRVQTLKTKEPDTIAWLEKMQPGEVFYDVGANMGQYSLIAAKKGVLVHAFEPESQNFALLCRNAAFNDLKNLRCWPIALSDEQKLDFLHVNQLLPGGSCNSFGESINFKGEVCQYPFSHGCFSYRLDSFACQYDSPTYVKIDVDGQEPAVIRGMEGVMNDVKSILVELNSNLADHREVIDHMLKEGFKYDEAQAETSRRTDGAFKGVGNVIFFR